MMVLSTWQRWIRWVAFTRSSVKWCKGKQFNTQGLKVRELGLAAVIFIFVVLSSHPTLGQLASQAKSNARAQIVMVSVDGGCAAGIIVGADTDNVYIASALHFKREANVARNEVKIRFENAQDTPYNSNLLWFDPIDAGDLAAIAVPRDGKIDSLVSQLDFAMLSPVPLPPRDSPVHSIGCSGGSLWSEGQNETLLTPADGYLRFSSNIEKGQSGGALYNEAWELIGMPVAEADGIAYARRIESIIEGLRKDHQKIPVQLTQRPQDKRVRGPDELARAAEIITKATELVLQGRSLLSQDGARPKQLALALAIYAVQSTLNSDRKATLESEELLRETAAANSKMAVFDDHSKYQQCFCDGKMKWNPGNNKLFVPQLQSIVAIGGGVVRNRVTAAAWNADGTRVAIAQSAGTIVNLVEEGSGELITEVKTTGKGPVDWNRDLTTFITMLPPSEGIKSRSARNMATFRRSAP
jgi:hypothetical protein